MVGIKGKSGVYIKTEEHKKRISEAQKGRKNLPLSEKHKKNISNSLMGHDVSKETKKKIGLANSISRKGIHYSEETKRKMRISAINYITKFSNFIHPRIGRNEKQILDKIAKQIGYKIIRQYFVNGYFLDGYIPKLNLAIEIDEILKNTQKDINRQKEIEQELNCNFIRIEDFKEKIA